MTNVTKALLPGLLAAIASGSTLAYGADCAHHNVPSWVHESEAYESCPREDVRNDTKTSEQASRHVAAPKHERRADADPKADIVNSRSAFRDDTAA